MSVTMQFFTGPITPLKTGTGGFINFFTGDLYRADLAYDGAIGKLGLPVNAVVFCAGKIVGTAGCIGIQRYKDDGDGADDYTDWRLFNNDVSANSSNIDIAHVITS